MKPHSTQWERVRGWQELVESLRSTAQSDAAAAEEKLIITAQIPPLLSSTGALLSLVDMDELHLLG